MAALIPLKGSDTGGWAGDLRAERDLVDDPILDPWGSPEIATENRWLVTTDEQ